jgi:hypothetical protein
VKKGAKVASNKSMNWQFSLRIPAPYTALVTPSTSASFSVYRPDQSRQPQVKQQTPSSYSYSGEKNSDKHSRAGKLRDTTDTVQCEDANGT